MDKPYSYGYDAQLYAAVHRGTVGDLQFYADRASGRRSVLELGCGYGRLIPTFLAADVRYVGLDIHQGLLKLCRRLLIDAPKGPLDARFPPALVRGDMAAFAFAQPFDLIVLPYSGLFCLPTRQAVLSCFRAVRAHLTPHGRFVIDVYNADAFHEDARPEDQADDHEDWVDCVSTGGRDFNVYERSRWNWDAQVLQTSYRYEPLAGGENHWGHIDHHYLLSRELQSLMAREGLKVCEQRGDFRGGAWSRDSDHLVIEARPV